MRCSRSSSSTSWTIRSRASARCPGLHVKAGSSRHVSGTTVARAGRSGPSGRSSVSSIRMSRDESERAGTAEGDLTRLFHSAGLDATEEGVLSVEVHHATFEDWWEPYTLGVGPAGDYVASLDDDRRERLRALCEERLPAPFVLSARAWATRARVLAQSSRASWRYVTTGQAPSVQFEMTVQVRSAPGCGPSGTRLRRRSPRARPPRSTRVARSPGRTAGRLPRRSAAWSSRRPIRTGRSVRATNAVHSARTSAAVV